MRNGRVSRLLALVGACLLCAPACDDAGLGSEAGEIRHERVFSVDESVLVCVTAVAPPDLSHEQLEDIYDVWAQTGEDREGHVTHYLFRFEDEPTPGASRYMFSLVFTGEPDGREAAASHRAEEYPGFREQLEDLGFTSVSLQSNLLHMMGAPEDSHPAVH